MNWTPDQRMIEIDNMEQLIIDRMGTENALDAICRALDYDTKQDIFSYIIRVYDLADDDGAE